MSRTAIRKFYLSDLSGRCYTLSSLQVTSPSLHTIVVTGNKPVVTRRYTYIVTSLQLVVTGLTGRRYRSRRYTVVTGCIVTGGPSLHVVTPNKLVVTLSVVTPYTSVVTYLGAAG